MFVGLSSGNSPVKRRFDSKAHDNNNDSDDSKRAQIEESESGEVDLQMCEENSSPMAQASNTELSQYYSQVRWRSGDTGRWRQQLACLLCDRVKTSRVWDMRDHIRNHLQTRPFTCASCGAGFNKKSNRDRHSASSLCARRTS